jgi:uncharacterized protein YuzE
LRVTYDPAANAIYVRLSRFQEVGAGETIVDEAGVIVDTDADGNPRGYEFLTVRQKGIPLEDLPMPVAMVLNDFLSSGALDSRLPVERDYET